VPVYPLGLTVVASGTHARILDDEQARRTGWLDLLPLSRYGAYGTSAESSFEATMRATALQAVWESTTLATSTVSELEGRTLQALTAFGYLSDLDVEVTPEQRQVFDTMLRDVDGEIIVVDSEGSPVGAWLVDPRTGAVIGRLPSARGGSQFEQDMNFLKNLVGWANWAGGAFGGLSATWRLDRAHHLPHQDVDHRLRCRRLSESGRR